MFEVTKVWLNKNSVTYQQLSKKAAIVGITTVNVKPTHISILFRRPSWYSQYIYIKLRKTDE